MPFLTPDAPPSDGLRCKLVRFPDTSEFAALFTGALSALCFESNWSQFGTLGTEDTAQAFKIMLNTMEDFCMLGMIVHYVTDDPPLNVLPADGATYLRVDYPRLYAKLDAAYIIDADSFVVPDLQGRVLIGAGQGAGLSDFQPNDEGGAENHELTEAELASHSHTSDPHTHSDTGHTHGYTNDMLGGLAIAPGELPVIIPSPLPQITTAGFAAITATSATINASGEGVAHNNMQPYRTAKAGIVAK